MTQSLKHALSVVSVLAALSLAGCSEKPPQAIAIDDPYVRATPQTVSAGYVTITNNTDTDDALTSVSADWAGKIELHNIVQDNDVMNMVPVNSIALPAHQAVELKSGSYHIMLFDLKEPLNVGDTRAATLNFQHAQPVKITFKVKPITYKGLDHRH